MASRGKNEVTLTFAGDTSDLERSFDKIGQGARDMASDVGASTRAIDRVGDSADNAETRFTGLASGIDGVTTLMNPQSPQEFAQGLADLADGVANFGVQFLKTAGQFIANHARMLAVHLANAARMAIGWIIAMGPIALVIAAVAAVIAILVALGVDFEDVKNALVAAWEFIRGAIATAFEWVKKNWPLILAILTGPIGIAVLLITKHWQTIKDGFTAVKNWIRDRISDVVGFFTGLPGRLATAASGLWNFIGNSFKSAINAVIGLWNNFEIPSFTIGGWETPGPLPDVPSFTTPAIRTPNLPYLHTGGMFRAPRGQREGLAMLLNGERVLPPGAGAGGPVVIVQGSILSERDVVRIIRDEFGRGGLGGVR